MNRAARTSRYALAWLGLVALAAASAAAGGRQEPAPSEKLQTPKEVLAKIHVVNQEEIELGELASEKASSEAVREYGETLVEDHKKADEKVTSLAEQKGIELEAKPELPPEKKQLMQKLQNLQGEEFDRAYLKEMVAGHDKVIEMLNQAQDAVEDQEVSKLVENLLPTLKRHRERADELLKKPTS